MTRLQRPSVGDTCQHPRRSTADLPIIIEVVETEEAIQSVLPELDPMIGGGLITLERAKVIMYRPANVRPSQAELHRIEGLDAED